MSSSKSEFTSTDDFFEFFKTMVDSEDYWLALFSGTVNPVTGDSWWGDCVRAEPHISKTLHIFFKFYLTLFLFIDKAIEEHWGDKTFVKCVVTRDEWKGNTEHPYRTHPQLGITGVPTLVIFQKGAQLIKK